MAEEDRYTQRTYFRENDCDMVKGFVILSVDEGGYFIGEKWMKDEDEGEWHTYHTGEAQLNARVKDGKCEPVGNVTEEQFEQILELAGVEEKVDVRELNIAA